jgi:hypothetical protein
MEITILGCKLNLEILILIGILYLILVVNTLSSTCNVSGLIEHMRNFNLTTEGFTGANTNYGESSRYNLRKNIPINTSSWSQPNLVVTPGKQLNPGVKKILSRPSQPIPLPSGELDMFATTQFKPECCPNTYSTSTGCACMTTGQYNYLVTRGGNNVPYSEY